MDRIIQMIIRQITRRLMRKGVGMAMDAGTKAWNARKKTRKAGKTVETIEQDPTLSQRRQLKPDERKGDDVLYPTDEYTEDMQPRR